MEFQRFCIQMNVSKDSYSALSKFKLSRQFRNNNKMQGNVKFILVTEFEFVYAIAALYFIVSVEM